MTDELEDDFLHAARIWFIREGFDVGQAAFHARNLLGDARTYASVLNYQERLREPPT